MQSEFRVSPTTLLESTLLWGRLLRRTGFDVAPEQVRQFGAALVALGVARKRDVKAASRALFTRRRDEADLHDLAFELFWKRRVEGATREIVIPRLRLDDRARQARDPVVGADGIPRAEPERPLVMEVGAADGGETLRRADFATLSADEARDALAMIDALAPVLPRRRTRRDAFARRGRRLALRRMLRRALGTGGEVLWWRWRRRRTRPRPVVLVCDISGSMSRYSRFLLRFAHALQRSGAPLEVFVFGTRLTRITRQLRVRRADDALARVSDAVVDWNGGTRIGASLATLNRDWVRRTVRSGAIVLVVSDGWERDDPARLAQEAARLARSCHRLLWLDPLASRPGFTPVTAGLRAVLPHVHALVPCGDVASLAGLARRLEGMG
ncbi:MAG: VWA domain-containing protein [Gemmatimonadales bacterium]|nr:VWA domain-containing protein [Gemmatimonadales bacterium]